MKKRVVAILFVILSVLSLSGCSQSKPEQAVIELLDTMKSTDMGKLAEILNEEPSDIPDQDAYVDLIKKSNETLTYKIGEVSITGDKAIVDVECTYGDITPIFGEAFTGYVQKIIGLAFSGISPSDEELNTIFADEITSAMEKISPKEYSAKLQINCVKEDGKWIIDSSVENLELADVFTGNLVSAFSEIAESMNMSAQEE